MLLERLLEPCDQRVELGDDGANRRGLAEVDAGALQQRHWMIAAAGFGQVRYRNLSMGIAALHSGWKL